MAVDEKNDWPSDGARKPRADRASNDEPRIGLDTHSQLAVQRASEVIVVFGTAGEAEPKPLDDIALDIDIARDAVARRVHLVRWTESRKHLGPDGGARTELVREAAISVGVGLAGMDLVILPAILGAECDVDRPREAWRQ